MQFNITIYKDDLWKEETETCRCTVSASHPKVAVAKGLRLIAKQQSGKLGRWAGDKGTVIIEYERLCK